jgi:site-specific DNA-methyltransferase (adenine-specific)
MKTEILNGDCIEMMKTLPDKSVNCCVTSPPYFGLRDYGHDGQIGLEETPEAFVQKMVEVFSEVKRVLRDDGTLWLNLGDSYVSKPTGSLGNFTGSQHGFGGGHSHQKASLQRPDKSGFGIPEKNLIGIPWRVAFALQADGWYLRQDIIWHKPNPMPESVQDRCTKAHEYIFLLSKSPKYYFNNEAIKEQAISGNKDIRNKRTVWSVNTKPYAGAHFATFPPELIRPCILAGCPKGGVVLDPFGGSGTTAAVAMEEGRSAILCELNPEYIPLINDRLSKVQPSLF